MIRFAESKPDESFYCFLGIGCLIAVIILVLGHPMHHALASIGHVMMIYCALCCVEIIERLRQ